MEADGGARGNPGPAGFGAVVRDAESGEVLAERSESIGVATNNVAEYRGLIAGLEAGVELGAAEIDVRMDSKLVIEQMSGRWQIKNHGLRPLAAQAAVLVRKFESVRYQWIPREQNRHADALANAAMDLAAGKPAVVEAGASAGPDASDRARAREVAAQGSTARSSWEPRPASTATRLLLVRHGETERTAQRRYSGRGDVPLSNAAWPRRGRRRSGWPGWHPPSRQWSAHRFPAVRPPPRPSRVSSAASRWRSSRT